MNTTPTEQLTGEPTRNGKCVYRLVNLVNGKIMVGSTGEALKRYRGIKYMIKENTLTKKAYDDIAAGHTFHFEILREFSPGTTQVTMKRVMEEYVKEYDSEFNGYNKKTIYRDPKETYQTYNRKHNFAQINIRLKKDGLITTEVINAAAAELGVDLPTIMAAAFEQYIKGHERLGEDWLAGRKNILDSEK
jgi:ABC-type oligopeptide transport system ATPase subunit